MLLANRNSLKVDIDAEKVLVSKKTSFSKKL